jgi:hypothetical protein
MPSAWIIVVALVALALGLSLWAGGRWLARSWEVLDDDQLAEKLGAQGPRDSPALWLLVSGWFTGGQRRLTYRRDRRGRFRRTRR